MERVWVRRGMRGNVKENTSTVDGVEERQDPPMVAGGSASPRKPLPSLYGWNSL